MIYAQGILTDRVWTDPEQTIDEATLNQICTHLGIPAGCAESWHLGTCEAQTKSPDF